jgi:hypothetical protein
MHIINNTFFSFFFIFLSITSFSQDIEEIIVKGDWREINVLEEDSSIVILNNQIIESQPIKHLKIFLIWYQTLILLQVIPGQDIFKLGALEKGLDMREPPTQQ